MFYLSAKSIRSLDAQSIASGLPGHILMENAGYASFQFLKLCVLSPYDRILIVLGKGNNAGDALVVLRYLLETGFRPHVVALTPPENLSGDAALQWQLVQNFDFPFDLLDDSNCIKTYFDLWHGDIIVDGLLGTGIHGLVKDNFATVINAINQHPAKVLALDIPSGLDCDSGQPAGCAVKADWTVTFAHPKLAMLNDRGIQFCGRVEIVDIGIPAAFSQKLLADLAEPIFSYSANEINQLIPSKSITSYKNVHGHLLVVAGSQGMLGAAILATKAACAAGAGLVSLALPESLVNLVAPTIPGVMCLGLPDNGRGHFVAASCAALSFDKFDALALGPGLGALPESVDFVAALINKCSLPMVIDADALNCLSLKPDLLELVATKEVLLTPHPGEFKRLSGLNLSHLNDDRILKARKFQKLTKLNFLLKGHLTIGAFNDGEISINPTGNPALAVAGSGDLLTGIIGAFLARNLSVKNAGQVGCYIHGLAADIATVELASKAVAVDNILDSIGSAIKYLDKF